MDKIRFTSVLILSMWLCIFPVMEAQSWNFVKEKDSIRIYTRIESGKKLKSFKAVAAINASANKIFALLENVNNTEWWDKSLSEIKVLHYVKNKTAQYYMVYDLPWPVIDRDVCVSVTDSVDSKNGIFKLKATPLPGMVAEQKDKVRIKDYYQIWTVKSIGKNNSLVELEGYVDPAGSIPEWVFNMVLFNMPISSIKGVKKEMMKR